MHYKQRTLAKPVSCSGIGVHSGKTVTVNIKPAAVNNGIKFVRVDLPDNPTVPALFNMVVDTSNATVIGSNGVIISTIEHLMASFAGLSIDNAIVELDSYEMPIMDGSAATFTELIKTAGIDDQLYPRCFFIIKKPIEIADGDKSVGIYPALTFKLTCTIEYTHPLIRRQTYSNEITEKVFSEEISKARTFGFIHEIEYLKQYGLARGASLESGVALDRESVLNRDGLRYPDEFVRHKILDCLGDFSLLGMPILGHIIAYKSGHAFNHAFLQKFFNQKESWETRPMLDMGDVESLHLKTLAI